ncbi:MAG TPA: 2-dehydropantoate 2-reductase [Candidatus Sulfotelmatobacter sp.]
MHHAILGAGGVGGLIGACLAHAGARVTLVVKQETLEHYPKALRLESPFGKFDVKIETAAEVPPSDVVWLTVKATQLGSALAAVKHPETARAIVPLLNGIDHIALLRSKYGADRIVPATIAVETERLSPGYIVHRSPFARLNMLSAGRDLLGGTVEQLQKIGFECRFIDDEPTLMWSKLVFLAPFALTTTAANKTVGEILSDALWRGEADACIREACAVGVAEGARVDPAKVLPGFGAFPANMRSSMQKDVEQHKIPELDAIARPILMGGHRHGIDVPATKKLVAAVERRAGMERLWKN